jgi:hypothetical protein
VWSASVASSRSTARSTTLRARTPRSAQCVATTG